MVSHWKIWFECEIDLSWIWYLLGQDQWQKNFTIGIINLEQYLIFFCISWNYSKLKSKIYWWARKFKKPYSDEPLFGSFGQEQLYGLFAEITLVENEQCNLTPDTCSKFDAFLNSLPTNRSRTDIQRSYADYYANSYKRQGENIFSFNNPTCNRRC